MSEQPQAGVQPHEADGSLAEVPDHVTEAPVEPTPLDEDTSEPDDETDAATLVAEVDELDEDGPPA